MQLKVEFQKKASSRSLLERKLQVLKNLSKKQIPASLTTDPISSDFPVVLNMPQQKTLQRIPLIRRIHVLAKGIAERGGVSES